MKLLYLGTAAAEGWPALFCSCPVCENARKEGGRNLRTRTQALLDGSLLLDFPPDTYCHALQYGLELGRIRTLLVTHSHMDHWFPTPARTLWPRCAGRACGVRKSGSGKGILRPHLH